MRFGSVDTSHSLPLEVVLSLGVLSHLLLLLDFLDVLDFSDPDVELTVVVFFVRGLKFLVNVGYVLLLLL